MALNDSKHMVIWENVLDLYIVLEGELSETGESNYIIYLSSSKIGREFSSLISVSFVSLGYWLE